MRGTKVVWLTVILVTAAQFAITYLPSLQIVFAVLQHLIRVFRDRIGRRFDDPEAQKRAATLGRVLRYIVAVVVSLIAGLLVLVSSLR